MASDLPPAGVATPIADSDFAFAFDDSNFSDRILKIEVASDSTETKSDGQECTTLADWARNRKRRREDTKRDNAVDSVHPEEQILSGQMPEMEGGVGENQYGEAVAMVEGSPIDTGINLNQLGDEAAHNNDSSWSMGNLTVLNVKTLHICSAILAAKSPFFYKLFSNGMMESEQRHVILRIHASEEAAFMDLLNFMYSNTLTERTPTALLDVLMCADKFEVASCMRYCTRLLRDLPMTRESALLYLDLPSSVLMAEAVQPLTEVAKQFLAGLYKDITKFRDDVINLPLAGIEAVLSNDDLQVASEDVVCEFVLKWARTHYPTLEERHEIISSRLGCLIRYPYMSSRRLRKLLTCNDFDTELVTKFVLEALFFKAEAPHRQRSLAAESANSVQHRFVERAYKYRPVKVVEFGQPHQQCIVYLDLKREECAHLFPAGRMYSQAFNFGSQVFFLSAHCNMDQQSSLHYFGLFVGMQEKGSEEFPIEYEFSARSKPTKDFVSKYKGNYTFTGGKAVGYRNLFSLPWKTFMAEDCPYFINGILHLRAELTYKP